MIADIQRQCNAFNLQERKYYTNTIQYLIQKQRVTITNNENNNLE